MDGQRSLNDTLRHNKQVACSITGSLISTFAGYPLDSLKARLQTQKTPISVPKLAANVYRDEGIAGFYRGLWVPLATISLARSTSLTVFNNTKEWIGQNGWFTRDKLVDVAITSGLGGVASGAFICLPSAPFELVKIRRQLEYSIAASRGVTLTKIPSDAESVREIYRTHGARGFWMGLPLHFYRDTLGTALYFLEYDGMRYMMGRSRAGNQEAFPWLPLPEAVVPFFRGSMPGICGSIAGVTSWAVIYPFDVVKTKLQQRRLAGQMHRGVWETLTRLIRGPDPQNPRPITSGIARIYRGLGVSAVRSMATHGLMWTVYEWVSNYIDALPHNAT